jgi:hypothetical protein
MSTQIITRTDKGAELTFTEMDSNFLNLKDAIDNISPNTILSAIRTVGGVGSGLNAEFLDGVPLTSLQPHTVSGNNVVITQLNSSKWMFNQDETLTGLIKINIASLYAKTLSGGMCVRITQNSTSDGVYPDFNLYISGNWSSSDHAWHNTEAINHNAAGQSLSVRFATDGLDAFILIGNTNTVWNYPRVVIENITSNAIIVDYTPDFSISAITDLTGITTSSSINVASVTSSAPVTVTVSKYAVGAFDKYIINNNTGTVTVTLPDATNHSGRELHFKNVQAQSIVSNASNVCSISYITPATSILAAVLGKWAVMVSDGTNWIIMNAN